MPVTTEPVNLAIKQHSIREDIDWPFAGLVRELHTWAERFIAEFNLDVPVPMIGITRIRKNWLGCYLPSRNAIGAYDEILISIEHAMESPKWRVFGTLLHEMVHAWQYVKHGRVREELPKGNYHDREFRAKAMEFGLDISQKGVTDYPTSPDVPGGSPFRRLLTSAGIECDTPMPIKMPGPTRSKLFLFECKCQEPVKIRSGRTKLEVRCLSCSADFHFVK